MKRLMVVSAVVVVSLFLLSSIVLAQDFCEGNFDYDKDVDGSDAFTFKTDFGRSQFSNPCPADGPAPVERTGQSQIYAEFDDGYYHRGVSWIVNRFTDNGNGTVTDNLTGLIWLKNANCVGISLPWDLAVLFSSGVCDGVCGLTDGSSLGDWRLPNVKELTSLIDYQYYNPAIYPVHPFTDVQSGDYWSSTTDANFADDAWYMSMYNGSVFYGGKASTISVWPVRGGHPY